MKSIKTKFFFIFSLLLGLIIIIPTSCSVNDEKIIENSVPICTIINPLNGIEIEQGDTVLIEIESNDPDGESIVISLYIDNRKLSNLTQSPFIFNWYTENEIIGSHNIRAIAYDKTDSVFNEISLTIINSEPIPYFSCDCKLAYEQQKIQFTDTSLKEPISWFWEFGEGTTSNEQNPFHIYESAGTYTISLTVQNNFGTNTLIKTNYITIQQHETGTLIDIDGNEYKTVKIGNQWWMAENLKTPHYADGTEITLVQDSASWNVLTEIDKAYCYYENSSDNINAYGLLYNWAAAMNGNESSNLNPSLIQGVCPDGWHLPSVDEWTTLIDNLGGIYVAGGKLKESSTLYWNNPNTGATNESGFCALPGGGRYYGKFSGLNNFASFWSTTEFNQYITWYRGVNYDNTRMNTNFYDKKAGFSVRCLKD